MMVIAICCVSGNFIRGGNIRLIVLNISIFKTFLIKEIFSNSDNNNFSFHILILGPIS